MRQSLGWVVVALLTTSSPSVAGVPVPTPGAAPPELFPEGDLEPPAAEESDALPAPSIREPFSIGEALYDPAGVPGAVVSLLDLMGVPVVSDQSAADRASRLTLSETEVRTLIALGVEDAIVAAESEEGAPPLTFADLHAFVAPFLKEVDVGQLAERYASAYERRPDDLAPKVMMGQPITPETPLNHVQIWLLLVDGFVGPGERPATAELDSGFFDRRATLAVYRSPRAAQSIPVAAPAGRWGTAQSPLANLISGALNRIEMPWVMAHLPLIQSRVPFTISPRNAVAHEGHGGPGPRLSFEAAIGAGGAPLTVPSTGRAILVPAANPRVAGRQVRWAIASSDREKFDEHGALQGPIDTWTPTDGRGAIRLSYQTKKEAAGGVGKLHKESAALKAEIKVWDLISSRYDLAPEFQSLQSYLQGTRQETSPVRLVWHSDGLDLELTSTFDAALDLGRLLGKTHRWGLEGVHGSLAKRSDGSFRGLVLARTSTGHVGGGLGKVCPLGASVGTQWLEATATPVAGLNANQDRSAFRVATGQTDGGYVKLSFRPVTSPVFTTRDDCQDSDELLWRSCESCTRMLPFNDARWTTPEHAWVVAIPRKGKLVYTDESLADNTPPAELGPLKAIIKGTYTSLEVEVERTDQP